MLKIGANNYQIVDAHSHISVMLYPPGEGVIGRQQLWQLTASFTPDEVDYTPPADGTDEYLELWLRAEDYHVQDWQQLSGFGWDNDEVHSLVLSALVNRLAEHSEAKELSMSLLDISLKQMGDFVFRCELDGVRELPDGTEQPLKVIDHVVFKEVVAYVPINAADPAAAAKAMAAKYINLTEFAGHRVQPYDPKRPTSLISHINSHHMVILQTAWREV